MARILVSSVGVGNENREYRKTNYSIEGNTYENIKFLASAINEHYNKAKFFLIGTSKSMWEEVYSNFTNKKNSYKKYGLQDYCRVGQNAMMNTYNEEHREPVNQKSLVYADYRKGKIDEEEKVTLIRSINKQYGIKSRV